MNNKEKFSCPECGHHQFITTPNSYDVYLAMDDKLCWQRTEWGDDGGALYCRDCGERAPAAFSDAAA